MPRRPRFAPPGLALHVCQRGNFGQRIFFTDADRRRFLSLLARHSEEQRVRVIAWCLMSNHQHLIVIPDEEESLSRMMERLAGEYSKYLNARLRRSGHVWKERYFACVLDEKHFTSALRYVELNPVRARIVSHAEDYLWSSAAVHLERKRAPEWLDTETFRNRFDLDYWRLALGAKQPRRELAAIREATRHGIPLAEKPFIRELEQRYNVAFPRRKGEPRKPVRKQLGVLSETLVSIG